MPDDFLRRLGINVPGKATRSEAVMGLEKALDEGEISFREFSIGEDLLNRGE